MLSIAAISIVVDAGQIFNDLWELEHSNVVTSNSEVLESGYSPFVVDLDKIFKMIFWLLMSVVIIFISMSSIKFFSNRKRLNY